MRLRSLFWRLFLGFWLMMMGLLLANVTINWLLDHHFEDSGRQAELLEHYTQEAISAYHLGGSGQLRQWRTQLLQQQGLRVRLLDQEGRSLTGDHRSRWMEMLQPPRPSEFGPREHRHRPQRPLFWNSQKDGTAYTLVILNPRSLRDPLFARVTIAWRIALSVLVVALLAYLMARYLTKPIDQLRDASRQLADGDLLARVDSRVSRRRDELGDLGKDFDRMASRLQALLEGQQQLLRDVSHELRTPLARQRVALELARRKTDPKPELDRIEREAELLDELIEEILQLVRLSGGAKGGKRQHIDIAELINTLVTNANFEDPRVDYTGPAQAVVNADPRLIGRALENVIRNALKYSNDRVMVSLLPEPQQLTITVIDNGPGIDESLLEQIFEPFVRVDSARSRDAGGWGLGLAIAKQAVRQHGGSINAKNQPQGGLCVSLTLPRTAKAVHRSAARETP